MKNITNFYLVVLYIFCIFEVKNVQLLLNISCEKNNELFNLQVEPKIKSTLPKITKKERIYLSIGVGTFRIICGLLFPFRANLISLITVPIIIEQIIDKTFIITNRSFKDTFT